MYLASLYNEVDSNMEKTYISLFTWQLPVVIIFCGKYSTGFTTRDNSKVDYGMHRYKHRVIFRVMMSQKLNF